MASATQTSGVADRYAGSLLELADEAGALDAVAADLEGLKALLEESADLRRLIESPVFSPDQQADAIGAIADKAGLNDLTANFIKVVAANRRLFVLPGMITAFRAALDAKRGLVTAEVTAAEELTAAQQKSLASTLKDVAGTDVQINVTVDPGILGGLVVRMGSRMIDTSLKTKLSSLKLALKEVG